MKKNFKIVVFLSTILFATSCITNYKRMDRLQLPRHGQQEFGSCLTDGEGSFKGTFYLNEQKLVGDVDWKLEGNYLQLAVYEPFGQLLLNLKFVSNYHIVGVSGKLANAIPKIQLDDHGYIILDNYLIGIKAFELPCFFRFYWPDSWLSGTFMDDPDRQYLFSKKEAGREISLFKKNTVDRKSCSEISWGQWLFFFRKESKICFSHGKFGRSLEIESSQELLAELYEDSD